MPGTWYIFLDHSPEVLQRYAIRYNRVQIHQRSKNVYRCTPCSPLRYPPPIADTGNLSLRLSKERRQKMKQKEPMWGIITDEYTTVKGGTRKVYTVTYERERVSTLLSLRQLKLLAGFLYWFISKEERRMK